MALFEEQITDTLTTGAPPIKYEGDQGPKSPQEERMAQLKQEYMQYVFEQKEIGSPIMSFEEWYQMTYEASKMGVDARQQPQLQPQPQPQMRQPVAYGGIMGLGGRRRYGLGSKIKSRIRKLIPNEAAKIAEVAAPFVAPFNPLIAGVMSGVGGFDRHGSISKGLKSGLINYGMGQVARGIGGAGPQWGLQSSTATGGGLGSYFTSPTTGAQLWGASKGSALPGGLGKTPLVDAADAGTNWSGSVADKVTKAAVDTKTPKGLWNTIKKFGLDNKAMMAILGGSAAAGLYTKKHPGDDSLDMKRGEGMDLEGIRTEVIEAFKDPTGKKLEEIRIKYPYLGAKETKNVGIMAQGGRIGYDNGGSAWYKPWTWGGAADPEQPTEDTTMVGETITKINERALATARAAQEAGIPLNDAQEQLIIDAEEQGLAYGGRARYYKGGQSIPSDYTIEDAMKTSMQDRMGGITDTMKRADLFRQGDVGQMYAAQGGRIGYAGGSGSPPITMGQPIQAPQPMPGPQAPQTPMPAPQPNRMGGMNPMMRGMNPMMGGMNPMMNRPMMGGMNPMMGGRRMAQEGGLMDLGGMEKDYRQEGGFVPLGGKEKADDVPARLSKNEFVFTADAVRGAGGGDIDKGAEIMENIMKNLEQGGQISEETQGLGGAREMFDVSERLSEVV